MDSAKKQPLYATVRETLRARIRDGYWRPGEAMPNEFEIGDELGVSQGTVRKALEELVVEHLVERRQGLGTFVTAHTPQDLLFRFFRLCEPTGALAVPDSTDTAVEQRAATDEERRHLGLGQPAVVIGIERTRTYRGRPFIRERIAISQRMFAGFDLQAPLPNGLYSLYQQALGINIVKADERLTISPADGDDAAALGLTLGTPLLVIDRIARGIDGEAVEWRVSRCHLQDLHYGVTLA